MLALPVSVVITSIVLRLDEIVGGGDGEVRWIEDRRDDRNERDIALSKKM
jgi:hypothetical protein